MTFKEFCEIAKLTEDKEHQIINPKGIYEEIERRRHFIPMEQIKKATVQAGIGIQDINKETRVFKDRFRGKDKDIQIDSNTSERE